MCSSGVWCVLLQIVVAMVSGVALLCVACVAIPACALATCIALCAWVWIECALYVMQLMVVAGQAMKSRSDNDPPNNGTGDKLKKCE